MYGGYGFGVHHDFKINKSAAYFAMMRDPIDRALSDYYYWRSNPSDRLINDLWNGPRNSTMLEYCEAQGNHFLRLLNVEDNVRLKKKVYRRHLVEAIRNIERWFTVVGLTEHLAETLVLLRNAFGWDSLKGKEVQLGGLTVNVNHSEDKARRDALTEYELSKIREFNALDIELYEHWKSLYYKQIDLAPQAIRDEVLIVREEAKGIPSPSFVPRRRVAPSRSAAARRT
eukprot:TRINITY_DN9744_c0_g1_i2.p1 TRINITY_DN9744_c0_g1~~TRINITY_DN9744_c0_g1_i2.p1  ORF type:complete len:228 (+),score=54.46 TRINITY_DN9744_c0_g1_i2:135-818(+)